MNPVIKLVAVCCMCSFSNKLLAETVTLPIKLVDKLILIKGVANNQSGYFLLDLGVSDVVLNSAHFKGTKSPDKGFFGINGSSASVETKWVNLSLGTVSWKRRFVHLLPLTHLEEAKGEEILGLIGGKIFSRCELHIDLSKMELQIDKKTDAKASRIFDALPSAPASIIPFKLKGGMPWIEVRINNLFFKFGIDTASEFNLLSTKLYSFVEDSLYNKRIVRSRGISTKIKSVKAGKLAGMEVGLLPCFPMGVLFTEMRIINQNLAGANLDGILGFDLLRQFKVKINYKTKELFLWRHDSSADHLIILSQFSQGTASDPPKYK